MSIRPVAQRHLDEGYDVCPLLPGTKKILMTGWNEPDRRFTVDEFQPDSNLGIRLGVTAPNGQMLFDADLDDPKAALIADLFLPATGAMFGRAGKPCSHRLYVCDESIPYAKFDGLGGNDDTLVELRGTTTEGKATQTVIPPSVWTDKDDSTHTELVEWSSGCALAQAARLPEAAILKSGIRNIAMALLIARAFPGPGNRHTPRLALAGFLLRLPQLLDDEVDNIGVAVMRLVGGDEQDWRLVLDTTRKKKNAGKRFTAGTALAKTLVTDGPAVVDRIREWLDDGKIDDDQEAAATQLARVFLADHYVSESRPTLYFQQGSFYRFEGAAFAEHEIALVRSEIYNSFPVADKKQVDEVMDALKAFTALSRHQTAPCWLIDENSKPTDILACRNGLLHVPTGRIIKPTPSFYTFNQLDFDYDAQAPRPAEFLDKYLGTLDCDADTIDLIQEMSGYALTPDRRFQKIFLIVGPRRGGKGTLARILKRLVGVRNVCHPSLSTIGDTFGRQGLLGKTLAIINDLRLGTKSDLARIAEVLLGISGEDDQTIHRKNKEDWHGALPVQFVIMSNTLPNLQDESGALASRFLVLQLTKSFFGQEDMTLADRIIANELPGVLNWAIEGRNRLYQRGHFVQPESGKEALRALEDLASPINMFIRQRCEQKVGSETPQPKLYAAWRHWCGTQNITDAKVIGTAQHFAVMLRAALPWITTRQPRLIDGGRERRWVGLEVLPDPKGEF